MVLEGKQTTGNSVMRRRLMISCSVLFRWWIQEMIAVTFCKLIMFLYLIWSENAIRLSIRRYTVVIFYNFLVKTKVNGIGFLFGRIIKSIRGRLMKLQKNILKKELRIKSKYSLKVLAVISLCLAGILLIKFGTWFFL